MYVTSRRKSWSTFRTFNQESSTLSSISSINEKINVIVRVEDTGHGIPLETQMHNLFIQVVPSNTRTDGCTGIGLSISKCLVHLMKGEIGLASSPHVDSTFTFTFVSLAVGKIQK